MASREKTEETRQQIVRATSGLLYRKGFNAMSFSDIAEAAEVPRGNLYYHFKTKDELLAAIIDHRLDAMRRMLAEWEETLKTPAERLCRYARIPLNEQQNVVRYGCPMGSLNTELGKAQPELQQLARKQFDTFREWLQRQFALLVPAQKADDLALHLLAVTQGIAVLAQAYDDSALIEREVERLERWLKSLAG